MASPRQLVSVDRAAKSFGAGPVLEDVSLGIVAGERIGVVGANGAGKSTLIRAIAGMELPRAGTIRFRDHDVTGKDSHTTANLGIGQVAEGRQVFPSLTVEDNLEVGALLPRARAKRKATLIPDGHDSPIRRCWANEGHGADK